MSCPGFTSDPDISGIGVRLAIYIQNLLSFIPAIWALWDGHVTEYELESVETQSTTILLTAFAILISAMVQAKTLGISSFHTNIVLSLSWMNNTNTFIYFLLYIQHKSQPGPEQVKPEWSAWLKHLKGKLSLCATLARIRDLIWQKEQQIVDKDPEKQPQEPREHQDMMPSHSFINRVFRRIVLLLGSLHLTLMACLGVWFWSNPRSFGHPDTCFLESTSTTILGKQVPLGSHGLQMWSLVIYSAFLMPGFNLILPMVLFLGLYIWYQARQKDQESNSFLPDPSPSTLSGSFPGILSSFYGGVQVWYNNLPTNPSIFPIILSMTMLFIINLIFLVDIELTLHRNKAIQSSDESNWTFGQVLAMLLLAMPLRDLMETMLERREKRQDKKRRDEHTESLKQAITNGAVDLIVNLIEKGADIDVKDSNHETAIGLALRLKKPDVLQWLLKKGAGLSTEGLSEALLHAAKCQDHGDQAFVQVLLENGADPNVQGGKYGTALQAASYQGDQAIVELLLEKGADLNLQGGEYGTALQAASYEGKQAIVELLLENGADPNVQGGEYGTALQAASDGGNQVIVELLLAKGADPNVQGGFFGTALQAASSRKNQSIVELLLEKRADPNVQGGTYGTALQAASYTGNQTIVELLLEKGADPNVQGGYYRTALQAASYRGNQAIVELLLEKGADPNVQGGEYGTALQAATGDGNRAIVELLLEKGADPNVQGGKYGTALQAASVTENQAIVELLLVKGADPNAQGGIYGTALQAACYRNQKQAIVELLLEKGADPNVPDPANNFFSNFPIFRNF